MRAEGFAMAIDELEDGTLSIAVLLSERRGRVVAAMSVASHRSRNSPEKMKSDVLPLLRGAADRVHDILRDFQDRNWTVL
ncbi:IclR family transcriptional regulator C-terminal domain-containing protein [Mesorhizobium sp. LMG 17147]|nr:IclR family transcriptional regulator C-terminal domain-containing protein [Mesorhizobium sp. LMG 17147]